MQVECPRTGDVVPLAVCHECRRCLQMLVLHEVVYNGRCIDFD